MLVVGPRTLASPRELGFKTFLSFPMKHMMNKYVQYTHGFNPKNNIKDIMSKDLNYFT